MIIEILKQKILKKRIYIYGAGLYAGYLCNFLELHDMMKQVECFIVSKKNSSEKCFNHKPLVEYSYVRDNMQKAMVIVAVKDAHDIEKKLKEDGYTDVYLMTAETVSEIKNHLFEELSKLPVQRTKIFFDSFDGKGYGCNPKYIAEYLLKTKTDLQLVWDIESTLHSDFPQGIKPVERYSLDYYRELYTAGILINNVGVDVYPHKRREQYVIHTWHGAGCYKNAGIDTREYSDIDLLKKMVAPLQSVDLFVSSTKGNTNIFRKSFLYEGEIATYGSPRVDIIFQNEGVRQKVCERLNIPTGKKILLYAPTYRDEKNESFQQYDLNMEKVLSKLSDRFGGEYVLIYRFHQMLYQYEQGRNYYPYGINVTMYHDVMEFLVAADVLITDYSSIMWDFGLQRRPIFLYQNDEEQYTNDRGFYKPISTCPYPIAHTEQELLDNIKDFDEQDYLEKLEAFIAADPSYDDGHASERVVERIMDVIEHPSKYGKE